MGRYYRRLLREMSTGAAAEEFDPSTVDGFVNRWRADDITTLANNDPVGTWNESAGDARAWTSSLTARPLWIEDGGPNGGACIRFDGSNDQLVIADAFVKRFSILVFKYTRDANFEGFWSSGAAGNSVQGETTSDTDEIDCFSSPMGTRLYLNSTSPATAYVVSSNGDGTGNAVEIAGGNWMILAIEHDADENYANLRLGSNRGAGFLAMDLTDVIVLSANPSADDIEYLMEGLSDEYGIALP